MGQGRLGLRIAVKKKTSGLGVLPQVTLENRESNCSHPPTKIKKDLAWECVSARRSVLSLRRASMDRGSLSRLISREEKVGREGGSPPSPLTEAANVKGNLRPDRSLEQRSELEYLFECLA